MRLLRQVPAILMALLVAPYLTAPVYDLPGARRFSGASWYNPYAEWKGPGLRTNLHAHSRAWGGLTHGMHDPSVARSQYASRGYDVASISNYHLIDTVGAQGIVLPVFEHGINAFKAHRLAIGANRVDWFDLPLAQSTQHKQYLIDRLHANSDLVALAHPSLRDGHDREDLSRLGGYELLEVLNHFGIAEDHWDAALRAGRPVWAIGNDDTHDALDAGQTGVMWTQVGALTRSREGVVAALRAGRHVAISAPSGQADVSLHALSIQRETLTVSFSAPVDRLVVLTNAAAPLATLRAVRHARVAIPASAEYVRVVAHTDVASLYLNPVLRSDGTLPVVASAKVNVPATVLQRSVVLGVLGWLAVGTGAPRPAGRARPATRRSRRLATLRRWTRAAVRLRGVVVRREPAEQPTAPLPPG